jgi:hypothetical protein
MNSEERKKTEALLKYLHEDFENWRRERKEAAGTDTKQLWEEVTEKTYCIERLHIPYESFNRWKRLMSPVSEINLLRIALSLRDTRPLEIYGFPTVDPALWEILVSLPSAAPEDRAAILRILEQRKEETQPQSLKFA